MVFKPFSLLVYIISCCHKLYLALFIILTNQTLDHCNEPVSCSILLLIFLRLFLQYICAHCQPPTPEHICKKWNSRCRSYRSGNYWLGDSYDYPSSWTEQVRFKPSLISMQDTLTSSLLLSLLHICLNIGTLPSLHDDGYEVHFLWSPPSCNYWGC